MLSYKREIGGNEKLMGWEGGIIAKAKIYGLELAHPRSSIQTSSILGPVLLNVFILEKTSQIFQPLQKRRRKYKNEEGNFQIEFAIGMCPFRILSQKDENNLSTFSP